MIVVVCSLEEDMLTMEDTKPLMDGMHTKPTHLGTKMSYIGNAFDEPFWSSVSNVIDK